MPTLPTPVSFSFLLLLLQIFSIAIAKPQGESTQFDFSNLSLNSLNLLGDAHFNNGTLRLSKDLEVPNSGSGRVLYSNPIRFRRPESNFLTSFSTFFSFSVTNLNPSSIGGGLAFLLCSDDQTAGEAGGFLGLPTASLSSFVAVEFDTLMDSEFEDINGNHVGLDLNSLVSTQVADLGEAGIELKSGNLVHVWIDFNGLNQWLNVSVSYLNVRPGQPLLSFHIDLDKFVSDFMFVGFTGSTQGSTEVHSIEWWSFTSNFSNFRTSTATFFNPAASSSSSSSSTSASPNSAIPSPPSLPPSSSEVTSSSSCQHNELCKQGPGAVAGVATAGAFVLAVFACLLIWVFSKRFKSVKKPEYLTSEVMKMPKEFSYKELKSATRCFDSVKIIGHGAFGTVYKGIIPETGALIAVKKCSHRGGEGKAEFLSELSIIASLRHRNLVRLQGWCHEKGEILLVYDFMPNGSLDKVLFESKSVLPWHYRQKILMGVASALAYLHQECENQVIHRDVKASNIMLDEGFNAKLGDFGLAKQIEHDKSPDVTVTAGTMGYLAPEYVLTGRATERTDVFSFGAVVLEVVTGRRPIEKEMTSEVGKAGGNLVGWVWGLHREGRLLEAADLRLGGEFDEGEMRRVLLIGLVCSHPDPMVRPTMRGVVQMFVGEAEVPIVPRTKPSMSFSTSQLLLNLQDSLSDCNEMITISTSSSSDNSFIGGLV